VPCRISLSAASFHPTTSFHTYILRCCSLDKKGGGCACAAATSLTTSSCKQVARSPRWGSLNAPATSPTSLQRMQKSREERERLRRSSPFNIRHGWFWILRMVQMALYGYPCHMARIYHNIAHHTTGINDPPFRNPTAGFRQVFNIVCGSLTPSTTPPPSELELTYTSRHSHWQP
jgi:hypothetical protein